MNLIAFRNTSGLLEYINPDDVSAVSEEYPVPTTLKDPPPATIIYLKTGRRVRVPVPAHQVAFSLTDPDGTGRYGTTWLQQSAG